MKFFENAKNAVIIMIAVIVGSSTISGVGAINKQADAVTNKFFHGSSDKYANQSIYNDLQKMAEYTEKLTNALSHEGVSSKTLSKLSEAASTLTTTTDVSKLYDAFDTINTGVYELHNENKSLFDDNRTLSGYYSGIMSCYSTISNENYNELVTAFHSEVDGFPGSLFELFANKVEYFK